MKVESFECFESVKLTSQQANQLMKLCEFPLNKKWKLLYRASRDGFGSMAFHSKCNKIPSTGVIIKSTNDYILRGFTHEILSCENLPVFKTDANAFLFSLSNNENKPLIMKCLEPDKAISCSIEVGPCFGGGSG